MSQFPGNGKFEVIVHYMGSMKLKYVSFFVENWHRIKDLLKKTFKISLFFQIPKMKLTKEVTLGFFLVLACIKPTSSSLATCLYKGKL